MDSTLHEVVPRCLHDDLLDRMGSSQWPRITVVHVEAGKRIYQLYAELDHPDDLSDMRTLAGYVHHKYGQDHFKGPWALETLGNAGGQTIVGALTTGTHGGDFRLQAVADSVVGFPLVRAGGLHSM